MRYTVKIPSLHQNFPVGFLVPALLLDFAEWLKSRQAGSVGYFSLQSERFDDYWIENGADLHPEFAFFARDPAGGRIGFWLHDRQANARPPIIYVGSEGELNIISDNLEEFLQLLAEGHTNVPELDSREEGSQGSTQFQAWLQSRLVTMPDPTLTDHPDLATRVEQWGQQQRAQIDQDPVHLRIAEKLRKYVKPNAQPWETANFDVLLVGSQFRMWHRAFGLKPLPHEEVADLEQLFRAVREQRARKMPERGLWFSSWVKVGAQGGAVLCCEFMEKPSFLDEQPDIPISEYEADFDCFSRSDHWMPGWLV